MTEKRGKIAPVAFIFCDEVRREASGKDIILGVYTGGVTVSTAPTTIIGAAVLMFEAVQAGMLEIEAEIRAPKESKRNFKVTIEITDVSPAKQTEFFAVNGLPVNILEAGRIEIVVRQDGGEWELVRTIPVHVDANAKAELIARVAAPIAPGPQIERPQPASS